LRLIANCSTGSIGSYSIGVSRHGVEPMFSRMIRVLSVAAAMLPVGANAGGNAANGPPSPTPAVVYCHDRARDVVTRVLASECRGEIISETEAEAIKQRRERAIAHTLNAQPHGGLQGLRLSSIGTAFYVNEEGRLLTNHHVVADCKAVTTHSMGHATLTADVLAVDIQHDLALLKVADPSPGFAVFRTTTANGMNASITAVGYPDEGLPSLEPRVTQGVILRAEDGSGHILIAADVRHGNSGGPILDSGGLVIGVVSAKLNLPRIYAQTGHEVAETGLGITVATVLDFLRRNNTGFHVANGSEAIDGERRMALARSLVARAECWR